MVVYNAATRELTAKIVYYGPGLGGKTTNLQVLHDRLEPGTVGKLLNLSTQTERTIYFDLLPVELGDIKGYKIRFQLATVPGQTAFNETRRVVLKGTDGIVFVADSQWTMLPKNLESWQNLKENLKVNGVSFEGIPIVIQYNKRDLPDILSVDAMQEALSLSSYPFVEAVASAGRGVTETFKLISKLTFVDLLRRLQGRRPEESVADPAPGRSEKDDLVSWRNSLLNRPPAAGESAPRTPLSVVPPTAEDGPFETEGPPLQESAAGHDDPFAHSAGDTPLSSAPDAATEPPGFPSLDREPPPGEAPTALRDPDGFDRLTEEVPPEEAPPAATFGESDSQPVAEIDVRETPPAEEPPPPPPIDPELESRLSAVEERIDRLLRDREEAWREGSARREALEQAAASVAELSGRVRSLEGELPRMAAQEERLQGLRPRIEAGERRLESQEQRVSAAEGLLDTQQRRQRTVEDDVGMALRSLSERGEKLHQQISTLSSQIDSLRSGVAERIDSLLSGLQEKTSQGQREAEDIRTQMAPLLEAHGQRREGDERMLRELDRLRESLAESLGELSDRLRAVRGA